MVNKLFAKKAVPLYRKQKQQTLWEIVLWKVIL